MGRFNMDLSGNIRESIAAGSFYPKNSTTLRNQINEFLDNVEKLNLKDIKALICPHAGYIYSGQVAAYSYKQIIGEQYDSIFIIAPSHSEYFDFVSIYSGKAYRTPLGQVNVDIERSKTLASHSSNIKVSEYGHRNEHSLEVQLPFLQVIFEDIQIVPIVMGLQNKSNIEELGNAIGEFFKNENILIIASTDLSHYHPYDVAASLDKQVEKMVENFDIEGLQNEFLKENAEMCGGGPVVSSMVAANMLGAARSKIIKYQNSGDVSGDKSAVVGYLSAVFYKN